MSEGDKYIGMTVEEVKSDTAPALKAQYGDDLGAWIEAQMALIGDNPAALGALLNGLLKGKEIGVSERTQPIFTPYTRPVAYFVPGDSDREFRAEEGQVLLLEGYANGEAWIVEYVPGEYTAPLERWNTRYITMISFKEEKQ